MQLSDSSVDEGYFADPQATPTVGHSAPRQTDDQAHVVRRSVLEEGTRPEYIIPVGSANGVWGMIKRIGRFRGEGWMALWKGKVKIDISAVILSQFILQVSLRRA